MSHVCGCRRSIECDSTVDRTRVGADVNAILARATPEYLKKLRKQIEAGTSTEDELHVAGVAGVHIAAPGGHFECVKILTAAGADVKIEDDDKRKPQ